jgi:hypothetical protein
MSVKRRLAAAGLPVAGATVFAALALTGPASAAAVDSSALAVRHGVAAVAATCEPTARVKCGYTNPDSYTADDDAAGNGTDDNGDDAGTGNGTDDSGDDTGSGAGAGDDDGRGNGDGYGGESPTPTPSPSPSGGTDNVPPGGEGPTTAPPGGAGPDAVPNGNGGTLPLTGAPMAAITTIGGLLTAAGAALCFGVWYNARRRRTHV